MRGRTKLVSLATMLTILLAVSMVYASGVLDVSKSGLFGVLPTEEPASPGPTTLFVYPENTVNSALQSGSQFPIYVNIADVTDLYAWQINLTWNTYHSTQPAYTPVLTLDLIMPNEFLARSTAQTSSEELDGIVINTTDNTIGYSGLAESLLTDVSGVTGLTGRLVGFRFLVVGYGSCDFTISLTGSISTILLSSTGTSITISSTTNGYFRNKYGGDVNGDKTVGSQDFSTLAGAYGKSYPDPDYDREADFDMSGTIGSGDFSVLAGNYGTTFP